MRDTIIFAGQSNTFGLGLEWELDPELNNDEFLSKGVNLPINIQNYDVYRKKYWKPNRWSTLVCNELGYKQFNVHDPENFDKFGIAGASAPAFWHIFDRQGELKSLLDNTKYIFLEIGYVRWWDENLHGKEGGELLPNTPIEIENYLNSKNPDKNIVNKAIEWIEKYDDRFFWQETFKKIIKFEKINPEIKIVFVPWSGKVKSESKTDGIYEKYLNIGKWDSINSFLLENKLYVHHKAKAFSGKFPILADYVESHASLEGQRRIAQFVIDYIQKLELNITDEADEFKTKFL